MLRVGVIGAALILAVCACGGAGASSHAREPRYCAGCLARPLIYQRTLRLAASACISALVTYSLPSDPGAPAGVPWIHAGPVYGYLFYYEAAGPWKSQTDRVMITPGGGIPGQYATKILWHVPGGSGIVSIDGQRLDGRGHFRQRFSVTGRNDYPSIVHVPSPGCWRITVTSGRRSGRFAFLAVRA